MRRKSRENEKSDISISKYVGEVKVGDRVKAYFAGCPVVGEIEEINSSEDEDNPRRRYTSYSIRVQDKGNPYEGMRCPVTRDKIIAKV